MVPNEVYSNASTVAGNGYYGYKDTIARYAQFENPISIANDKKGNIYIADANLNMIRKISAAGIVSTLAGNPIKGAKNGQDTAARFNYPTGVAVDTSGNVYVADYGNNMIRMITPTGLVTTLAGNINSGHDDGHGILASFSLPYSLAIDKQGALIVADTYNNRIRKVTTSGDVTTVAGTGAPGRKDGFANVSTFNLPVSVAVDNTGFIYVADKGNNCIRKITPDGFAVSTFSDTTYKLPTGVAVDNQSRVYLSTEKTFNIIQFDVNGKPTTATGFSGGSYKRAFNSTDTLSSYSGGMGLIFDGQNSLLIADAGNSLIRKVAVEGYSVLPRLPNGLSLDGTGSISGTPLVASPSTDYTITAHTISGLFSAIVNLSIGIGSQTITFGPIPSAIFGPDLDFPPLATSTDTVVPIVYNSSNLLVATIVNNNIHLTGPGTTVITATQAASPNFTAAVPVSQTLTVNAFPVPTITAIGATNIIKGDSVTLVASPSSGYAYQWTEDGVDIPGATLSTYQATKTGSYVVKITTKSYSTSSQYIAVLAELQLPVENFKLAITGATCKGSNNGAFSISAAQKLKYNALITGNNINKTLPFTDTITVAGLSPGNYNICITVDGEIFNQCFQANITEPQDLSVYSTVNDKRNTINLQLHGANSYNITLNDVSFNTTQASIDIPLANGYNKLVVSTDKLCQGIIEKSIMVSDKIVLFPNPFQSVLNVNIGNENIKKIIIDVVNVAGGTAVAKYEINNQSGILQLDLSPLRAGLYYLNLNLDSKKSGYKIFKK